MNNEELKKIIIKELIETFGNGKTADTYFSTVADNIISKLPQPVYVKHGFGKLPEPHWWKYDFGKNPIPIKFIGSQYAVSDDDINWKFVTEQDYYNDFIENPKYKYGRITPDKPQPVITEDGIVEVLLKNSKTCGNDAACMKLYENDFEAIASEILQDNKWEVVARGKAEADINDKYMFYIGNSRIAYNKDFEVPDIEGKNIIIAIKEVK